MIGIKPNTNREKSDVNREKGFTLIELMVVLAISGFVAAVVYIIYDSQQKSYVTQEQVSTMQQNLRAVMHFMQREIRLAGYDPLGSNRFSVTDIRRKDINDNPDVNGNSCLEITIDRDENGILGAGDETVYYSIADFPTASPDGNPDLARRIGAGARELFTENIAGLGFAYAFDDNADNQLDTSAGGNIIWAVDSDNDNDLDTNLDTDDDGDIDLTDNPAGTALASDVNPEQIRAVMIWLLARVDKAEEGFYDRTTYAVANRRVTPNNAFRHRLLTTTLNCRNMGL
jgi:type IV pilus assembly protein PilW